MCLSLYLTPRSVCLCLYVSKKKKNRRGRRVCCWSNERDPLVYRDIRLKKYEILKVDLT